jgi:hypothetical protein
MTGIDFGFEFGVLLLKRTEKFKVFCIFFGVRRVHGKKRNMKIPEITLRMGIQSKKRKKRRTRRGKKRRKKRKKT